MSELAPEDEKILTLARSARARTGRPQGAAVRDDMGRTYTAASVDLPSLRLSALQAVIAAAVSSGSTRFEAAVVVADGDPTEDDRALLADVGSPTLLLADSSGQLRQ